MQHIYNLYLRSEAATRVRAFERVVARHPGATPSPGVGFAFGDEHAMRPLFAELKVLGTDCFLEVATRFDRSDALLDELGMVRLGVEATSQFRAVLPKDAFDLSTGCRKCGLGAKQVKPYVLSERSVRCGGRFHRVEESSRFLMKAEIGHAIVEATRQPECMRHPVTRSGRIVREWLEPVPTWTMPPLSRKSEGVMFGTVRESDEVWKPCAGCGRTLWDKGYERAMRLVYPRPAAKKAQNHAVVSMLEPFANYPEFDVAKGTFKYLGGLPLLLFSRRALEVLVEYIEPDKKSRGWSSIEPVYAE